MAVQLNENSQSIELAERALELIKRHNLSADPSSYAVWYAYVGGNTALVRSIEGVVADKGNLSDSDVDEVRQRYLSDSTPSHD